jgi:hypothetical protein
VALHLGLVVVAARVAGLRPGAAGAGAVAAAELAAAVVLALLVTAARRHRDGAAHSP